MCMYMYVFGFNTSVRLFRIGYVDEYMCSNIVFVASASRLLLPAAPTVYCIHVPLVDGTMVRGRRRYNYSYEVFWTLSTFG